MMDALQRSYGYCEQLSRREAGNFYHAFRVLPGGQRRAMCALYAFLRITDDLSDEPGELQAKQEALAQWRVDLDLALAGTPRHPLHAALVDTVRVHHIPVEYLHAAIDGVCMDLQPVQYTTFAELRNYCYHVASVVGLACIHIWGFRAEQAKEYAATAGIAFQLTNILRDLAEDAQRSRVYLPQEDLTRFGYDVQRLRAGTRDAAFRELMRFEVGRARDFYRSSEPLLPLLEPTGRAVFLVMARTYRGLLDVMEQRDYDVFSARVRLSRWRKILLALRVLPVRWGWVSATSVS